MIPILDAWYDVDGERPSLIGLRSLLGDSTLTTSQIIQRFLNTGIKVLLLVA